MIYHSAGKALKQQTMKAYEDNLSKTDFVRIHRSYIVKVGEINRIEPYGKDNYVAILQSGDKLPVSRAGLRAAEGGTQVLTDYRFNLFSFFHPANNDENGRYFLKRKRGTGSNP